MPNTLHSRTRRRAHLITRFLSAVAGSTLVLAGLTIGAEDASASSPAALTMNSGCTTWTQSGTTAVTVSGAVGDTFTALRAVTGGNGTCAYAFVGGDTGIVNSSSGSLGAITPTTFTIVGPGTFSVTTYSPQITFTITVVIQSASSGVPSTSSVPADVFQAFGRPVTGTCADAASTTLNWAGVSSGGWGESWGQWLNDGKGGAVCNRILRYDSGRSKWMVA
jgi:hypothetical protein